MIVVQVDDELQTLVSEQAPRFNIGGMSNLNSTDLAKADRGDFQYTGLYGEAAWFRHRYGADGLAMLRRQLDFKYENYTNTGKGDNGEDDRITFRGTPRFLDVKTTHIKSVSDVARMNLVVAPREMHPNMVYVAAFAVGPNRQNATEVVIAGWCLNEDLKDKFFLDPVKFAMKVPKLTPIENLSKHF